VNPSSPAKTPARSSITVAPPSAPAVAVDEAAIYRGESDGFTLAVESTDAAVGSGPTGKGRIAGAEGLVAGLLLALVSAGDSSGG
jgi:hypothetical protein